MASSHQGAAGDSTERSKMSLDQKRELVYNLSKDSHRAFKKFLQDWTSDEIRQILCAESEEERKYTGLKKDDIINKLFKIVSKKNTVDLEVEEKSSSPKRQRKDLDPVHDATPSAKTKGKGIYCKNLACQAKLRRVETFCKRCSCCICYKYDNNKDPSLWLTCNSDSPFDDESCGFSCHLDCALNSEKSGLKEDKLRSDIDGCFYCVFCRKRSSFLECLKKQLMIAVEERRVDILCHRLVLAQKLLKGTKKYSEISEKVEEAVQCLETELGVSLTALPSEMSRGIVNRLCCVKKVKEQCSTALKLINDLPDPLPSKMQTEESNVSTTALEEGAIAVLGLLSLLRNCNNVSDSEGKRVNTKADSDVRQIKKNSSCEETQNSPITHRFRSDEEDENANKMENVASCSFEFEHCVKLIRKIECSGLVKSEFRRRFLTWYSLRATAQEKYVVKTFVDTFKEDKAALAEQLIDTFSDCISRKRPAIDGGI